MRPLFSSRSPALTVATTHHRGKRAAFKRNVGYVAQKRIFVRFKDKLIRMRLHERARGDVRARIALSGFCTPAVRTGRGSLWVLPLSHSERQEERALRTGIKRPNARAKQRPAGVLRFTSESGVVRLLKSRPRTTRRARR